MKWIYGLLIGAVCLAATPASADVYNHASTAQEGYWRGYADWMRGCGEWLQGLGEYQNLYQQAYRQSTENWANDVRTKWTIQDEYKARNRGPSYLDLWQKGMDNAERRYALKQRENELIRKGVLTPRPEPYIMIRGVKYKSFQEYKALRDAGQIKEINQ